MNNSTTISSLLFLFFTLIIACLSCHEDRKIQPVSNTSSTTTHVQKSFYKEYFFHHLDAAQLQQDLPDCREGLEFITLMAQGVTGIDHSPLAYPESAGMISAKTGIEPCLYRYTDEKSFLYGESDSSTLFGYVAGNDFYFVHLVAGSAVFYSGGRISPNCENRYLKEELPSCQTQARFIRGAATHVATYVCYASCDPPDLMY